MKIGRTNAITISGGGTTKTDYELWQDGFNANWDSVIQNAPQAGNQPCLFIYNKVNEIKYASGGFNAVTYNPETDIYTPIVANANNKLVFSQTDYFTNSYDNNQYVCVVLKTPLIQWGNQLLVNGTPMVYANTKYCNTLNKDLYVNPLYYRAEYTPLLRGVDCFTISTFYLGGCLEHLTLQEYAANIQVNIWANDSMFSVISDTQIRILKEFVENAPITTVFIINSVWYLQSAIISDAKLADWYYNDFFYKNYNGNYGANINSYIKKTYKFKVNSNLQLTTAFKLNCLPDCLYLEGTFTENQSNDASSAGLHYGFKSNQLVSLKNFPMWKVKEGATTGCLLPMKTQTNVNFYLNGSFDFYSTNLEPKRFCEFDENGIIKDATKYFICNLPIETISHTNIQVRFRDLLFKNNYTAAQQSAISTYLTNKKWNLVW